MKNIRQIIKETVEKPKSPDEQRFIDQHYASLSDVTPQDEDSYTSNIRKAKRLADHDDDKAVYDMAYAQDEEGMYDEYDEMELDDEDDLEEEMTSTQMKKREEIVKSMKDKTAEFKDKYGDRWKDVMYATATKMAMKEETELSEEVIDDIMKIVDQKQAKSVKFSDGTTLKVDLTSASVLKKIYDALNDANKKKLADALNKNEMMFMKMLDFAFSKVK